MLLGSFHRVETVLVLEELSCLEILLVVELEQQRMMEVEEVVVVACTWGSLPAARQS